jgi:hypothetical protein
VKYKLPSGIETSESRFETKAAALGWGRDQEARIREGRWTDPDVGKITVSEWIDRWLAMQDVGISTVETREYLIRRFLRPAWGERELGSLNTEDIGPDGGHGRRSNYARRIFRPACDGRYHPGTGQPARLVIAEASAWPGLPVATWPAARPGDGAFTAPRSRGIQPIPEGVPLACCLPVKFGLTPYGLRHSHKT